MPLEGRLIVVMAIAGRGGFPVPDDVKYDGTTTGWRQFEICGRVNNTSQPFHLKYAAIFQHS